MIEKPFELSVREVPTPRVTREDDVLIRVISGSICGSDIGIYTGTNSLATYPRIIGHEFCGRVVETGSAVSGLRAGDVVAVDPVRSCGACYACRAGRPNVCRNVECAGVHRDGGFAEYSLSPASACHRIDPEKIPADLGCFVEPFSIGVQVSWRAGITGEDTVLVMGSGPIGICVMQVARARGARVMMTDILPERVAHALECGADSAVNVAETDLKEAVMAFTGGEGAPVVVDSVCSLKSVPQAMDLASPAGRVAVLGLKDSLSEIAQVAFTKKELTVVGSRLNNGRFPEVISLMERGLIHPEQLMSATFPFTEAAAAIRLIREHPERVCKVRLMFDGEGGR